MEFVVPDLIWGKKKIPYTTLTWSGTDTQASRQIEFEVPWNPYDKAMPKIKMAKGDVVELRVGSKVLFVGQITTREKTNEIGTAHYTARDFMHHLLGSTGTYVFKKTTPEAITKKVCKDVGITTKGLFKTGISIKKMIFENQCLYDIIIKAYRKVKSETGKKYLPVMDGTKVSVIEKGGSSGVTLTNKVNIISASYEDSIDNIIDLVKIFNDKHQQVGVVTNEKYLKKYGVYQAAYQKESGKSSTKGAKAMLVSSTREASVEALGDIRALSGYSIKIKDPATGLEGKFFVTSDSHTFENGNHTMKLELSWNNTMEEGADTWKKQKTASTPSGSGSYSIGSVGSGGVRIPQTPNYLKNVAISRANNLPCHYLIHHTGTGYQGEYVMAQTYYHSTASCGVLKKEKKKYNEKRVPVGKVGVVKKQMAIIKAPNTRGKQFKCCPSCWKQGKYSELLPKSWSGNTILKDIPGA